MAVQHPQTGGPEPESAPVRDSGSRVLRWAAAAALLGTLLVYNSLNPHGQDTASGVPPVPQTVAGPTAGPPTSAGAPSSASSAVPALGRSVPTRLSIPSIGVDAPFVPLSLGADGALEPPPMSRPSEVGYYADGPTPGEQGAAIVAGHVDTKTGPAVFLLLSLVKPGASVAVKRADGSTVSFKVDSVQTFSKATFPDQKVYGDTPDAQLRIITCGGTFDRTKQDYQDNVVVFAHLTGSTGS
ncbi:class F sortase [Actinacidiphila acidipaludis]|uniref:Class F sortase n=1 Tax=Actinacidiphila acidipaludis TaxID=2873382 RepID=A0ABS7QIT7_9ACTN|nr:class F sortase [Streptomyces acidipaludis]MBY8883087.1 class F sortase [Streptomyces acidipaludis]